MYQPIKTYCQYLEKNFAKITEERKEQLTTLAQYITQKYTANKTPKIIVICTHNSRRSHIGQVFLSISADYYGLPPIESYSGGTEATAFNPRAVAALQRIGIKIQSKNLTATNPIYEITWKENQTPYQAFSKKYDSPPNPTQRFAALLVCTEADTACPLVIGTDFRLSLPFNDPKAYDDTPEEAEQYDVRCTQIATEILYVFKRVGEVLDL